MVEFVKYHGLGNDFILADAIRDPALAGLDWARLSPALCDRRTGVGADGVLLLEPARDAHAYARIVNADGSDGGVCGNGLRCAAMHLADVHSASGNILIAMGGRVMSVTGGTFAGGFTATVNMGAPVLDAEAIPVRAPGAVNGCPSLRIETPGCGIVTFHCVGMGNPHAVTFDPAAFEQPLGLLGPFIEHHAAFPQRVNVHTASILSPRLVRVKTWERGAGVTQACGTGACAVLVAGVLQGVLEREADVAVPGGTLRIAWDGTDGVRMSGPAVRVSRVTLDPAWLRSAIDQAGVG